MIKLLVINLFNYLINKFHLSKLAKCRFFRLLHNILVIIVSPVNFYGQKLYLIESLWDNNPYSIYSEYEPKSIETVRNNIYKGNTVIDIGAHIGLYSLIFAESVGDRGLVYAFEPEVKNFRLLKKNVKINGYKNITLLKKAVSNYSGKAKIFLSMSNSLDHRIYKSVDHKKAENISVVKLDQMKDIASKPIDFVKIDVQGIEYFVLQGMKKCIQKNVNMKILIEFWPYGQIQAGIKPIDFLNLIKRNKFKIFEIDDNKRTITKTNIPTLLEKYTYQNKKYTNLFLTRMKNEH